MGKKKDNNPFGVTDFGRSIAMTSMIPSLMEVRAVQTPQEKQEREGKERRTFAIKIASEICVTVAAAPAEVVPLAREIDRFLLGD